MKTRLYNARILSMVEGQEIFNGEIHIDGSRITYVGGKTDGGTFDKEIDCSITC